MNGSVTHTTTSMIAWLEVMIHLLLTSEHRRTLQRLCATNVSVRDFGHTAGLLAEEPLSSGPK